MEPGFSSNFAESLRALTGPAIHANGMDSSYLSASECQTDMINLSDKPAEESDMNIKRVGIDLAKQVFQIHGVNGQEKVVIRKQLRRAQLLDYFKKLQPCLIGMEACGGAHYWARELQKQGHTVKLMAPQFVKPYVKSNKTMPTMRKPSAKRLPVPRCGLLPLKRSLSKTFRRFTASAVNWCNSERPKCQPDKRLAC
jgi:hypothetical protein